MVYTLDSKSIGSDTVRVRVPPPLPIVINNRSDTLYQAFFYDNIS